MRSFEGQHSDRVPIRRSPQQKEAQLRALKDQLAALKSHAAPAVRTALEKRIAELQAELAAAKGRPAR